MNLVGQFVQITTLVIFTISAIISGDISNTLTETTADLLNINPNNDSDTKDGVVQGPNTLKYNPSIENHKINLTEKNMKYLLRKSEKLKTNYIATVPNRDQITESKTNKPPTRCTPNDTPDDSLVVPVAIETSNTSVKLNKEFAMIRGCPDFCLCKASDQSMTCHKNSEKPSNETGTGNTQHNQTFVPFILKKLAIQNIIPSTLNSTSIYKLLEKYQKQQQLFSKMNWQNNGTDDNFIKAINHLIHEVANISENNQGKENHFSYLYQGKDSLQFKLFYIEELTIVQCNITKLASNSFKLYPLLTKINLSNNELNELRSNFFSGLSKLVYLDLSYNEIEKINRAFIHLKSLESLKLNSNRILKLHPTTFLGLDKVTYLNLEDNSISSVDIAAFQPLSSLTTLILSNNPLLTLVRLNFFGSRLQYIDVSNIKINKIPQAITQSIRNLRLSGNSLIAIQRGDLESYPYLGELNLEQNQLEMLEEDALGRHEYMQRLFMGENNLREVPQSLPISLVELYLQLNQISSLKDGDFRGLESLQQLFLLGNNISSISTNAFGDLINLKTLNLRGNFIASITTPLFVKLTKLSSLDLSENPLMALKFDPFLGLEKLQVLHLSNIEEETVVADESFTPLVTLEVLDLEESPGLCMNLLNSFTIISSLKSLREIYLIQCNISSLHQDIHKVLPNLEHWSTSENEFNMIDFSNQTEKLVGVTTIPEKYAHDVLEAGSVEEESTLIENTQEIMVNHFKDELTHSFTTNITKFDDRNNTVNGVTGNLSSIHIILLKDLKLLHNASLDTSETISSTDDSVTSLKRSPRTVDDINKIPTRSVGESRFLGSEDSSEINDSETVLHEAFEEIDYTINAKDMDGIGYEEPITSIPEIVQVTSHKSTTISQSSIIISSISDHFPERKVEVNNVSISKVEKQSSIIQDATKKERNSDTVSDISFSSSKIYESPAINTNKHSPDTNSSRTMLLPKPDILSPDTPYVTRNPTVQKTSAGSPLPQHQQPKTHTESEKLSFSVGKDLHHLPYSIVSSKYLNQQNMSDTNKNKSTVHINKDIYLFRGDSRHEIHNILKQSNKSSNEIKIENSDESMFDMLDHRKALSLAITFIAAVMVFITFGAMFMFAIIRLKFGMSQIFSSKFYGGTSAVGERLSRSNSMTCESPYRETIQTRVGNRLSINGNGNKFRRKSEGSRAHKSIIDSSKLFAKSFMSNKASRMKKSEEIRAALLENVGLGEYEGDFQSTQNNKASPIVVKNNHRSSFDDIALTYDGLCSVTSFDEDCQECSRTCCSEPFETVKLFDDEVTHKYSGCQQQCQHYDSPNHNFDENFSCTNNLDSPSGCKISNATADYSFSNFPTTNVTDTSFGNNFPVQEQEEFYDNVPMMPPSGRRSFS